MSEREPTSERRYGSPRDEALHAMAEAGWANESSGEEGSNTGPFWRISNSIEELDELQRAFGDQWQAIGVEPQQVVGHFLLGHAGQEAIVMQFEDEDKLIGAFQALRNIYVASKEGLI